MSPEQLDTLCTYSYPGNVREFTNILDRARALEETDFAKLIAEYKRINRDLCTEREVGTDPKCDVGTDPMGATSKLVGSAAPSRPHTFGYPDVLDAAIRQHVKSVFDKNNHNLTATKNALGISINTLKKYLA